MADDHGHGHDHGDDSGKLLFFASDGMRQDAVEKYADEGVTPGFRELLKQGAYASDNGLLTQAPPNTGAGWFTLTTGAWPGVHGSTNNTFHINGAPFGNSTAAFARPEHPAGRDARPGGRARRQEGRPDRVGGRAQRLDQRARRSTTATSAPAAAWRPTTSRRRTTCRSPPSFGRAVRPRRPARARDRLDERRRAPTARQGDAPAGARRQHATVDKYGLNAYIYDSKNDRKTRYDRVLFSRTKSGADKVADLEEGEWADVKVKISRRPTRSTARPARS